MSITDELREYAEDWDWLDTGAKRAQDRIEAIAERIDAEHETTELQKESYRLDLKAANIAVGEAYKRGYDMGFANADDWLGQHEDAMAENGWIRLPKDADGEYIHIGDVLTDDAEFKSEGVVECLMLDESGWFVGFGKGWTDTKIHEWHHYHAPTVEDVLRDMHVKLDEVTALYVGEVIDSDERDRDEARIFAEYAAKLRLAEGDDA